MLVKPASWFSFATETTTNEKGFDALYLATTDDQTTELANDHLVEPINASALLKRKWSIAQTQNVYKVIKKKSKIRISTGTSLKSAGKGVELLGIDEAREFPGKTLAVILPTIQDTHGIKCMKCREKIFGATNYKVSCPTPGCDGKMRRFFGRCVIMSNAAIIKDDPERDWYADILRSFNEDGIGKNDYVFALDDSSMHNPDICSRNKKWPLLN